MTAPNLYSWLVTHQSTASELFSCTFLDTGEEKPIAYASRTLNSAERHYSQLKREGLAIVFGVKKFHNYLYGRHFTIESDHQPLSHLFNETKSIPAMASARIQRWALTLAAYQYNIRYKLGKTLITQML